MTMAFWGNLGSVELLMLPVLVLYIFLIIKFFQIASDTRKMKNDLDEVKYYLKKIADSQGGKKE